MAEPTIIDLREEVDAGELRRKLIPPKLPRSEQHRVRHGRNLDLARIESALLQADSGNLVDLTDLESEVMALDPHLSAVVRKRVGSIQCLPWRIEPASGAGVDPDLAEEIADVVRQQLRAIPDFEAHLVDLAWAAYYGRAALEVDWVVQGGRTRWRPARLRWIHPRRLAYGPERELRLINTFRRRGDFVEQGFALEDFPGKFVTWMPRLFNEYPEREGLAPRTLYWAFFKRFSWRLRMALTELFGIPWRIVEVDKDAPVNDDAIQSAFNAAEKLGETTAAAFGRGMKLNVPQLNADQSELFGMNSEEVNSEMSKLVLGQTGTTDPNANRAETIVQKGEQDVILSSDATGIDGSVQRGLVSYIAVLNYGDDGVSHCPDFVLDATPPRDIAKEQERINRVVMLGVPVAVAELREVSGVRAPEDGEPFVVAKSPGVDALGNPLPPVPQLIDPSTPPQTPPPLAPPIGGTPTMDDEMASAGGLEDEGTAGQDERAEQEAEQLARAFGIPIGSARLALDACERGDFSALKIVPGLGTDDQAYLVECYMKPRPIRILLDAVATEIEGNHGHELRISDEEIDAGQGGVYSIKGAADHDHAIELSQDDMEQLKLGEQVTALSTEGGRGPHAHSVTVTLQGANVDDPADVDGGAGEFEGKKRKRRRYGAERQGEPLTLPFAGYENFEACVLDQVSRGHDDEAARRICGALQEESDKAQRQAELDAERDGGGDGPPFFRW